MGFCLVNNYALQVSEFAEEEVEIGMEDERSAGPSMQLQSDTRDYKRRWSGKTALLSSAEAEAAELWLQGQAWHISFENGLQSAGGLCPDPGYAGVMVSTDRKFGTWSAFGALNNTIAAYRIPVRTRSNDWSISLWYRDVGAGGVWTHLCVVSRQGTITRYVSGSVVASSAGSTTVVDSPTSNAIRFTLKGINPDGTSSSSFRIDDVVLFNWPLHVDQVTGLATSTRAFSEAPVLELAGDVLRETGPVLVRGFVDTEPYQQVQDPTLGWDNNQRTVSFSFEEV